MLLSTPPGRSVAWFRKPANGRRGNRAAARGGASPTARPPPGHREVGAGQPEADRRPARLRRRQGGERASHVVDAVDDEEDAGDHTGCREQPADPGPHPASGTVRGEDRRDGRECDDRDECGASDRWRGRGRRRHRSPTARLPERRTAGRRRGRWPPCVRTSPARATAGDGASDQPGDATDDADPMRAAGGDTSSTSSSGPASSPAARRPAEPSAPPSAAMVTRSRRDPLRGTPKATITGFTAATRASSHSHADGASSVSPPASAPSRSRRRRRSAAGRRWRAAGRPCA